MRGLAIVGIAVGAVWLGVGTSVTAAPPPDDPCLAECKRQEGGDTDRATCRLQCREAEDSRTAPNRVEWQRTEHKGGSPDRSQPRGATTTTTTTTPSGTTVSTTQDASARKQRSMPRPSASHHRRAWCVACGLAPQAGLRLTCWSRCASR